jgi:ferredoxin
MWLILTGSSLLIVLVLWLIGERGHLLLPSTSKFIRMAGRRRVLNLSALHGYVYLRLQKPYLRFLLGRNPTAPSFIREWFTARYHGKVLTQDQAKKIITIDRDIPLQNLEQVIPHQIARSIVLKASQKIVAFECACRHARPHPCQPTQVCLFIGEPYAEFMLEHHPSESRELTRAEALRLLDEEHARGHLHSAWFKDAMMGRFYALCNCCKCCCGGIENMVRFHAPQMASSGYVAQTDAALCEACGTCVSGCPFQARSLEDNRVSRDWDRCMGCGVCVGQCPNKALALVRDERKGAPLEVDTLPI